MIIKPIAADVILVKTLSEKVALKIFVHRDHITVHRVNGVIEPDFQGPDLYIREVIPDE